MEFSFINIDNSHKPGDSKSILIIYTGGTFGMAYDDHDGLVPFDFHNIIDDIPELDKFDAHFSVLTAQRPVDSANIEPEHWKAIGTAIIDNYESFDGFIVLHGTDTMAYSASAISYLLRGLEKPVIFTGAQIPIGAIRSDARDNLITAIEICSADRDGIPLIHEVCIYFNEVLLRGNRSVKIRSSEFGAFESLNYPILAKTGINIDYNEDVFLPLHGKAFITDPVFDKNIVVLRAYPGMDQRILESVLCLENLKGVIIESYGSGTMTSSGWFLNLLQARIEKGLIVINVSQCIGGKVDQERYATSRSLQNIGVVSGRDITTEAALSKLMLLSGMKKTNEDIIREFGRSWSGEIT